MGRVWETPKLGGTKEDKTRIQVLRYLKGVGSKIVSVSGFGSGSDCRIFLHQGDERIFYLYGKAESDLYLPKSSLFFVVQSITPENIEEIRSVLKNR